MVKVRTVSGCRDCKRCTNPAVANIGRSTGRAAAGVYTLGLSELARGFTRNCAACGHKLSLHGNVYAPEIVQGVPMPGDGPGERGTMGPGDWKAPTSAAAGGGSSHTCSMCAKSFSSDVMLKVHQNREHRVSGGSAARQAKAPDGNPALPGLSFVDNMGAKGWLTFFGGFIVIMIVVAFIASAAQDDNRNSVRETARVAPAPVATAAAAQNCVPRGELATIRSDMAALADEATLWGSYYAGIEDDCDNKIVIKTTLLPNDEQRALPMCWLLRGYDSLRTRLIVVEDGLEFPFVSAAVDGGPCRGML